MMREFRGKFHGFTLLEVLVAVLVLSFGLLGIAGLLLATVQNNTIAAQRTSATFLAQDMADRIRSNINATKPFVKVPNSSPARYVPQPVFYLNSQGIAGQSLNCYGGTPTGQCATRDAVAERDLFVWNQQIAASLPGGQGIVCQDISPDDGSSFAANQCDGLATSPWVIKIFWVVRAEDQVNGTLGVANIQRFSMMLGGT
jgi:type IV pilus assembly protein PilV